MPLTHDLAICLRRLDYSETSQILLLLTRDHGLVRVIAKGAKRTTKAGDSKFSGGLDLLEVGRAVLIHSPERQLSQLTEWSLLDGHLPLRRDLRRLYLAQLAAELVTLVFEEHDPHPDIFDDLGETLHLLARTDGEESVLVMALRLLRAAGLLPDLGRCVGCQQSLIDDHALDQPAFFSPAAAGGVCNRCEALFPDRIPIGPRFLRLAVKLVKLNATPAMAGGASPRVAIASLRLPTLGPPQVQPLIRVLVSHIVHQQGRECRMAAFAAQACRPHLYRSPEVTPAQPWLPPLPPRPLDPEPQPDPTQIKPPPKPRKPRKSRRSNVTADLSDIIVSPAGPVTDPPTQPPGVANPQEVH